MFAKNQIEQNSSSLSRTMQRLSSGLRINSASDDPSGNIISSMHNTQMRGALIAVENAQDAVSMLDTAYSALLEIEDLVIQGRDKVVRAYNDPTLSDNDKELIQSEIDDILASIDAIANLTEYGDKELINGGSGITITTDTQAEWAAGTYNADEFDLDSSAGDLKLKAEAWDTDPMFNTNAALNNQNAFNIWLTSYTDIGGGRAQVTLRMDACRSGVGTTNYKGQLILDSGISNVSINNITSANGTNVVYSGGGVFSFNGANQISATQNNGADVEITFEVDIDKPQWQVDLTSGPATTTYVEFYYGSASTRNMLLSYSENGYFTDMTSNATYEGAAVDMEEVGGEAVITWSATQPGGTSYNVKIQESADGVGGWTDLPLVDSGGTLEYNQRYLRAVIEMSSAGIAFGTPSLDWIEFTRPEPLIVQAGPDNMDEQTVRIGMMDARSSALGIAGVDIIDSINVVAQYDSSLEMLSGFKNLNNIDILSDPGFFQLDSPISQAIWPAAQANGAANCYINLESVTALTNGQYQVSMSLNMYGYNPPGAGSALRWVGDFEVYDSDGQVQFDQVWTIDADGVTPPSVPVPSTFGSPTGDGTSADATIIANDGSVVAGSFNTITFDNGTGNLKDGFGVTFTCDPDAYFVFTWENEGLYNAGGGNVRAQSFDPLDYVTSDIYFGPDKIAEDYGGGVGSVTITRRLAEYNMPGSFTTSAIYLGDSTDGFLQGVTNNPGDPVQYRILEDATGTGAGTELVGFGGGTTFTTSAGNPYIWVEVQVNGTADNPDLPATAGVYNYTQSGSPRVDGFTIARNSVALVQFDNAVDKLSEMKTDICAARNELLREISFNNSRAIAEAQATSRLKDADYAREIKDMAVQSLLTSSASDIFSSIGNIKSEQDTMLLQDYRVRNPLMQTISLLS